MELEQASIRLQHALVELVFLRTTHATHGTHAGIKSSAAGVTGKHEAHAEEGTSSGMGHLSEVLADGGLIEAGRVAQVERHALLVERIGQQVVLCRMAAKQRRRQ